MRILVIIGDNIWLNSSTNIFKNRLINELSLNHTVTVLMDNNSSNIYRGANIINGNPCFIEYSKLFWFDIIKNIMINDIKIDNQSANKSKYIMREKSRSLVKSLYQVLYKKYIKTVYKRYRYNSKWLKRVQKYQSAEIYELILSISHPPASHKAAIKILSNGNISCKKYFQLWFEPWFQDPIDEIKSKLIQNEERNIIQYADTVYYVGSYYHYNQTRMYPEYSSKMEYIDLPIVARDYRGDGNYEKPTSIGYFGNYYSSIRNIRPLYKVLQSMPYLKSTIIGDTDLKLDEVDSIFVKGRMSYQDVLKYENKCDILVVLWNIRNQIPGKVYEYASTCKYILVILDGSEYFKNSVKNYFMQFNRYVFCENNKHDIRNAIHGIIEGKYKYINNKPVEQFYVNRVIDKLLESIS